MSFGNPVPLRYHIFTDKRVVVENMYWRLRGLITNSIETIKRLQLVWFGGLSTRLCLNLAYNSIGLYKKPFFLQMFGPEVV